MGEEGVGIGGRNSAGRINNNLNKPKGYDLGWAPMNKEPERKFSLLPPMGSIGKGRRTQGTRKQYLGSYTKSNSRAAKGKRERLNMSGSDSEEEIEDALKNRVHYYGQMKKKSKQEQKLQVAHERYIMQVPKYPTVILSTYNHKTTQFKDQPNRKLVTNDLLNKYRDFTGDKGGHIPHGHGYSNHSAYANYHENGEVINQQGTHLYTNNILVPLVGAGSGIVGTHMGKMLVNPLGMQTIDTVLNLEEKDGKQRTESTRLGYKKRTIVNMEYMRKSPSLSVIDRKIITSEIS